MLVAALFSPSEARALGALLVLEMARRPALADALASCPDDAPAHTRALAAGLAPRPIGVSAATASAMLAPIARRLRIDPDPGVRRAAATRLGEALPEPSAEAALITALEGDPSAGVQEACARGLLNAGGADARAALARLLRSPDAHPTVRDVARDVLARLAPLDPDQVDALARD